MIFDELLVGTCVAVIFHGVTRACYGAPKNSRQFAYNLFMGAIASIIAITRYRQ